MSRYLKVAGLTDVGRERDHNEDSFGLLPQYNAFVVADGMGGHKAGDVASQMSIEEISNFFKMTEKEDVTWPFQSDPNLPLSINRFITSIQVANNRIFHVSNSSQDHQGMGTTVVGILSDDNHSSFHVAHVGDSRCYRIRNGAIDLITMDHSLINDYLRAAPDLSPEQIAELPTNVITRALGMQEMVGVDYQTITNQVGDIMLLCSDGLNGMLEDHEILEVVQNNKGDLTQMAVTLIETANARGGEDNITVILVEVAEE